ncbi:uncharacterized protein FIBRA_05816 [Fibroporia radiculosa]|uniref:Methyltransferase domain-containing protein n=1 Tax=Fibroporia radiculosa TaxID=599839 RepID=J4HY56_9APHY|nr:uncharacterized protein FIBRA_05816 [Fibroporia radiculosa]CCM03672.1 predicted protein [Fibroporia radiculosa]
MLSALPMHAAMPSNSTDYDMQDDHSDTYSVLSSSSRFAPSIASSATSCDWEMRSASPAPSVYSVTSSLRAASYRHEFGRGINNYSDVYRLPADDEEFERLDLQHLMFMEVMGKYPPPLPDILRDDIPGEQKTCVDLGCGSGSWSVPVFPSSPLPPVLIPSRILDVARDFPHCSAVAVDLVPMQSINMPPNCRSEVDDINLGLQHFYGDFNVVHARLISSGVSPAFSAPTAARADLADRRAISVSDPLPPPLWPCVPSSQIRDYEGLIDQMAQALRPGGLLDLTEFDFRVYDLNKKVILDPKVSAFARWMNLLHDAVQYSGGEPDAANHLETWVSRHSSYEHAVYREFWFASSPWRAGHDAETRWQNRIANVFRDDVLAFLKSGRTLLLGTGLPEKVVDEVEEKARTELMEARVPSYVRVENVYARKKHQP